MLPTFYKESYPLLHVKDYGVKLPLNYQKIFRIILKIICKILDGY